MNITGFNIAGMQQAQPNRIAFGVKREELYDQMVGPQDVSDYWEVAGGLYNLETLALSTINRGKVAPFDAETGTQFESELSEDDFYPVKSA